LRALPIIIKKQVGKNGTIKMMNDLNNKSKKLKKDTSLDEKLIIKTKVIILNILEVRFD
jgi:hypothetical protein